MGDVLTITLLFLIDALVGLYSGNAFGPVDSDCSLTGDSVVSLLDSSPAS